MYRAIKCSQKWNSNFKCFLIYYNSGIYSKALMGKVVIHLWLDTTSSHVQNTNPSRADDHHNGRFPIPITRCISLPRPYPSQGTKWCRKGYWESRVFGGPVAVKGRQSVLPQVYGHYGVVGGEYWQPINHFVRTDLLGNPLLLRGISLLRRFSSNKSSLLFVFLSTNAEINAPMNSWKNIIHSERNYRSTHSFMRKI